MEMLYFIATSYRLFDPKVFYFFLNMQVPFTTPCYIITSDCAPVIQWIPNSFNDLVI